MFPLRVPGGVTGDIQVPDTDLNKPFKEHGRGEQYEFELQEAQRGILVPQADREIMCRRSWNAWRKSIDFDHQELGAVLASQGYAADTKTIFVLEGVTQYLTEAGIQTTFDFLAKAPAGSRLVFTYVCKDFIDGKVLYDQEYLYKKMLLKDKIWFFGIDPEDVADFLGVYGWRVLEHLGYEELAERYVKPTGRKLVSLALERVVYAEKL